MKTLKQLESFVRDYLSKVHGEDFSKEKPFEKDLLAKLKNEGFEVESQLSTQPLNEEQTKAFSAAGTKVPDLVVKVEEGFIPIELKFDNTPSEYWKDRGKINMYCRLFSDIPVAMCIFLDKENHDDYREGWKSISGSKYRYQWFSTFRGNLKLAEVWNERRKGSSQGPKKTFSKFKPLILLFALMMGFGNVWGATGAPSGLRTQSSFSYASTDTIQMGGKVYEVFWCNNNSSYVKTAVIKKQHNGSNTEAIGSDKFCVVGSSVGTATASATGNTIDEFTWSGAAAPRYWRVRHTNAANFQIVIVVKGYDGVAALHKAGNNLLINVERYNTATSSYVAYTPETTSVSSATSSHYKTYASLDVNEQFKITFLGSGTSGSDNRDMMAFSLCYTPAAAASDWQVKGLDDGTWAGFDMTGTGTVTCSRSLSANTQYTFKLYNTSTSKWWGNGTMYKYTREQTIVQADAGENCYLRTSKAGTYTFSFNTSTKALTVTYPDDYKGYWYPNGASWSKVYAYCYNEGDWKNADWPGVEITSQTEDICGTHYYVNTSGYTTVIFNNGNSSVGNQTGNIAISGGEGKHAVGAAATAFEAFTYNVTYDANGGTGTAPTDATNYSSGASVPVKDNTNLAKSGYYFAGWNTKADGSGDTYVLGQTFSITSCTTLYAKWNAVSCPDGSVEGTVFKLQMNNVGTTKSIAANEYINTAIYATMTNGSAIYGSTAASKAEITKANPGKLKFGGDAVSLKLNLGCPLQAGDIISFTTGESVELSFAKTSTRVTTPATSSKSYTIPAGSGLIGASTLYFWRASGSTVNVTSLTITRPAAGCTAPTGLTATSTTAKGTTFTITDGANTNDYEFYVHTSSSTPAPNATPTHTTTNKTLTITDRVAGTTYYAWVRSKCSESNKSDWVALTGNTFTTSTVNADYHLTNVTKSSGATTGIGGSTFTAEFAAVSGYSLPSPVVTIGGNAATSGTHYTWNAGTGTLTINADKINGDIDITMSSPAAAPTNVAITGDWLYFAGETIELTAAPTGGNGPVTYQWYKGGKADGNAIEDATNATFSKTCAFSDAGSYYCKVTCGGSESTWGQNGDAYEVKVPHLYVKTGRNNGVKSDFGDVDFTRVDASTATASMTLGANWDYCFNIADGCGHYYGNAGTMQYNNYGPWVTNVDGTDCGLTTTNGATYVFTINYSNWSQLTTTVTFPSSNQAADKVIYFDNSERQWTNVYYRIGHTTHVQASAMDKVYGTANLYTFTTTEYNNFMGWHITNATGETGSNTNIYNTVNSPAITYATAHEGGAVTQAAVTVTPTTSRGNGADVGVNNNCEFFNYDITSGMKTDNVSITAPSNGTITVVYDDVAGDEQSFTSGNRDLAHTVILKSVTAAPATGYDLSTLTISDGSPATPHAHTNGNSYTCFGATTIAATFALHNYNVTYSNPGNGNNYTIKVADGSATSESKTATMGQTITIVATPAAGYDFTGWTISKVGGGTVSPADASATTTTFTMPTDDVTITASFTLKTYTVNFAASPAGYGTVSPTSIASVSHGSPVSIASNVLTLKGTNVTATPTAAGANYTYAFSGWSVSNGAAITEAQTITANFTRTANQYSVTHSLTNMTTGSGATGANAATYGTDYTATLNANSGYSRPASITVTAGATDITANCTWNQSTGAVTIPGSYITGNITITAEGVLAGPTYTVTYEYNGRTGGDSRASDTQASAGASVTLPTPTKTNYIFHGWYASDGTSIGAGGASYTPTADITVYALWHADCAGGGGGGGGTLFSQNFDDATEVAYAANTAHAYTKTSGLSGLVGNADNLFTSLTNNNKSDQGIGINTSSGANSEDWTGKFGAYHNGTSGYWSIVKSTNLAATAPTAVQVKFDALLKVVDNGTSKQAVTVLVGSGFSDGITNTLPGTDKIYTGFTFYTGSSSSKNHAICKVGSTTLLSSSEVITRNSMQTFTWVINKTGSSLTYTAPTGSNETVADGTWDLWMGTTKILNDQSKNSGSGAFTGTTIQNLYIGSNTGVKHEFHLDNVVITDLTPGGGTCFYVRYSGNGAEDGFITDETAHSAGSNVTVLGNTGVSAYTKAGYTFMGWNTQANGQGTSYAAGSTINAIAADVTLHAQWQSSASVYTLTWDANGGSDGACTGTCTSGSVASGTTLVAPEDPTLSNYTFDSWKTNNDGTGSAPAATMPAANTTYYAAWKQTVTLNTGSYGEGADKTPYIYLNGSSLSDATVHTAAGYTLNGYYTAASAGTKVLNADGSLVSDVSGYTSNTGKWNRTGAAVTLYAQWRATGGASCNTIDHISDFPSNGSTGMTVGNLKVTFGGSKTSREDRTIYSGQTNRPTLKIGGNGPDNYVQGYLGGNEISSLELGVSEGSAYAVAFSASSTFDDESVLSWSAGNSQYSSNSTSATADTLTNITVPSGAKYFRIYRKVTFNSIQLGAGSSVYVWHIKACTAGASTHTISYNNGGGSGSMSSHTSIADDGSQKLTNNSFTAPTNFAFAGWVADVNVTIGGSTVTAGTLIANGATITNITKDIALTAKWSQTVTLDDNNENHGATGDGSATAYYNAAALSSITHTTAASGYKLAGYYTAKTDGTKVLNADGTYAGTAVTGWISDSKWTQNATSTPTLYAQYESAGALTWNLGVNTSASSLTTDSKSSAFTEISTANMSNATVNGLTYTGNAKASLTGKISTPAYDPGKYVYVTFQVAAGYKFIPSSIKVPVQPVGNNEHKAVELRLTDDSHSLVSGSATKCDGTEKGKKTTVTLAGDGTFFIGTVTLKIYVYPHEDASASSNNCYRLGTPITIDGEVEETCATMPSYTSMSYTTTSFLPDADASGSPITIIGGDNIDTYQWKYNTVNDRTSGEDCGSNSASLTPITDEDAAADVTRYYWCEMTNTACGLTIKSPAVAITVEAEKTEATVTWSNPGTINYGGGGYAIRATVDDASWNGNAANLTITAPAGIRIYNVTPGTDGNSEKYVEVNFDVTTAYDRTEHPSNIPFTVSAAETATYDAIANDNDVAYEACAGGGGAASEELMPVNTDSVNSTVKGWRFAGTGKMWYGHGSSTPSTGSSNIKSLDNTMAGGVINKYYNNGGSYFSFYTEKAITGVRLYVYTSNNGVKVSNVYIANSQFATGTPSSGAVSYDVVYNDDNDGLDKGDNVYSAWAEITFDSEVAAGKYGLIKLDNNVRIAGIGFLNGSSSGASLTTTLSFATAGPIEKHQGDASFTNTASPTSWNSNTLGAITYSSSNTSCATVNTTTGEVTITATGESNLSTTITATLAASGCYRSATTTYTLTVIGSSCTDVAGTVTTEDLGCSGIRLTLSGYTEGATIKWYKDGNEIDNATTNTYTATTAGSYYAVTHNECDKASNTVEIADKTVSAERIVEMWYIKNGRVTPDIALWSVGEGTSLSSVAFARSDAGDATAIGLTSSDFYLQDGVIYLKGKEPLSNDTGEDIEYTLTLTVTNGCTPTTMSDASKKIKLIHQKNTDKHVLAFVVVGTANGGFTEGIPASQTTSLELYNTIAENFDVQATNIKATDDEKVLKQYYSQFDILCITDYPNTGDKGNVAKQSYVNAIGSLIDIRPILTMEAFVAKLSNWAAKGVKGTPNSPCPRQYSMDLQCKDHEIFSGTEMVKIGEGDDEMYRVTMVDKSKADYSTKDGNEECSKAYDAGGYPALQGFTIGDIGSDMLPLGLIYNGETPLQVGIERQHEMSARLMVLGIQQKAMERLTEDGQTVVINALKYLMKKNEEDIADCSIAFYGGTEGHETDWNTDSNWKGGKKPDKTAREIRILAPVVITGEQSIHAQAPIKIASNGTYNGGADNARGSISIEAGGALRVDGKIQAVTAPAYSKARPTSNSDLYLGSSAAGNGSLVFNNEAGDTKATVAMYTTAKADVANMSAANSTWQYIGTPHNDIANAQSNYYNSWLYQYNSTNESWEVIPNGGPLVPFRGYCVTHPDFGHTFVMEGTLTATGTTDIDIPAGKYVVVANSWVAPIDINTIVDDDMEGIDDKTIYFFNTGSDSEGTGSTGTAAGTYRATPIHAASYTGDWQIPSMQGFYVVGGSSDGALHLDYDRHVCPTGARSIVNNAMYAPKRAKTAHNDEPEVAKLFFRGHRYHDKLVVLEREDFTRGYDSGWDGEAWGGNEKAPMAYVTGEGRMDAVSAVPEYEGTVVGFRAGEDEEYTIDFIYDAENEPLYLLDTENNLYTRVLTGNTYYFTTSDKAEHSRFVFTRKAPQIATGVEPTSDSSIKERAKKLLIEDKMYILLNGMLYDATGKVVK